MKPARLGIGLVALVSLCAWSGPALAAVDEADDPPPTVQAQASPPRIVIGVYGAGATSQADGLASGTGFGGSVAAFFHSLIGVEVGVRRHQFDVEPLAANQLSIGSLDATMITANAIVRFVNNSAVTPWVGGGVAVFRNDFQIDSGVAASLGQFNFTAQETVDDILGYNVAGGVDVQIGRSFGVFGEGRWVGGTADTAAVLTDTVGGVSAETTGSQDINALTFAGGIRFFF